MRSLSANVLGLLRLLQAAGLAGALLAASGCAHKESQARMPAPQAAPPPVHARSQTSSPGTAQGKPSPYGPVMQGRIAPTPAPPGGVSDDDLDFVNTHAPIRSEEGLATWYTAAKGRKSANGQLFSDHALTAAHRTLPMGSLIVVTNLTTGQSAAMRITDRGPFVGDKLLDLTIASAKATGIYRVGTARVRLDVYRTPKPIDSGGRWCVQVGAFTSHHKAEKLKAQLLRKYPDATVIEFPGEDSYWVRIRPDGDNREKAELIARRLRPAEG
ncbi:MAG: septal ring lytic transglycosylase RlpA family protein, partial [Terracidiphilus sp.]